MTKQQNHITGKGEMKMIHSPLDFVQGSLIKTPEYIEIDPANTHIFHAEEHQQIVLIKGTNFIVGDETTKIAEIATASIYILPIGSLLSLQAKTNDTEAITISFLPTFNLCLGACPGKIGQASKEADGVLMGKSIEKLVHTSLPFSGGISKWFDSVKDYIKYSYTDFFLYELKLQELFRLLNLEYSRTVFNNFISQVHCRENGFRKRIFALKGEPMSLGELAEHFNLSESILKRRFMSEFGMPPQKWLALQRSRYIFRDIIQTNSPIKDIAEKYKFSTTSYLSIFCKKYLGDTPQNIRKHFADCPSIQH